MTESRIRGSVLILVLSAATGCENVPVQDVADETVQTGTLERWECGDYVDGCLFRCPVKLTADFLEGTGTVEFAGTISHTRFGVKGLERRWDWCLQDDGSFGCAFTIDADDDGKYFDFSTVMPDTDGSRRTKPKNLFKCMRRRVN